jgi:preprotein translocase SecY subunit
VINLRFLDLFKPISRIIPEVKAPVRKVSFQNRLLWTLFALIIYFVMSETPLYGIPIIQGADTFQTVRIVFASQRGTLMELGIGPIVTAGLIIQLLAGSEIISFDRNNSEDRGLFTTASKFFSLVMIIVQSSLYILSGQYGDVTLVKSSLIFIQLLSAGVIIMMLDELVQKGWGIGSGISLFIVAGITQTIWWSSFSFVQMGDGKKYGAILAFIDGIWQKQEVWQWFYRPDGWPDMIGFSTTIAVFLIVVYFEGMRVELPIAHSNYRGYRGKMPLKLLYVSNIPVILAYSLFASLHMFAQLIWSRWNASNSSFWLNMIAMYEQTDQGPSAIGGMVYYTTSPRTLSRVFQDPVHAMIYALIVIAFCIIFSITWLQIGGQSADQMADQLINSGMQVPGFRRDKRPVMAILNRYIPTITIIGGALVGALAAFSDFFGVFGSGTGALLAVSILYQYYQTMVQEQIEDIYPILKGAMK